MNSVKKQTLAELGERKLIENLKKFMPTGQIDDDTALINLTRENILLNTDIFVEGIHFSDQTTSPKDIGWRAIAANVSDLTASGANQIIGVSVGLVAPPQTSWNWVEEVYEGIITALNQFGGIIFGGDCSKGKEKMLAITALGSPGPLRLHRSNAIPGDSLVVSGPHGLSRLGLAILQEETIIEKNNLPHQLKDLAILSHQRPKPPINALRALEDCKPIKLPWRAGGLDSSDGLFEAIYDLCITSNCQVKLEANYLPRANEWPAGGHWDSWCLNGGEDFELVVSLPPEWANAWIKIFPQAKVIGKIQAGHPKILLANGNEIKSSSLNRFKHF